MMPFCRPCVPYIQDELKDYRCRGNTGKEIPASCPARNDTVMLKLIVPNSLLRTLILCNRQIPLSR